MSACCGQRGDGPADRLLRRPISRAFLPARVAGLRARIQEVVDDLIDEFPGTGEVELLSAFALPLPLIVICEYLGIPTADRPLFQKWGYVLSQDPFHISGPGEVRHLGGPGALGCQVSWRVLRLREALREAWLASWEPVDIWAEMWGKFLLVVPIGSVGAAADGASIGELRSRVGTRRMLIAGMREIHDVATALGIALPVNVLDDAIAFLDRQPGHVTTSLQQDILAGRPSELDDWTGAVVRLADRAGTTAPIHETLYELLAVRASLRGCAPARGPATEPIP